MSDNINISTDQGAALIRAEGVNLRYGKKTVLDNLSFTIPKGRVVGLLGHNGAGKTTLMKAMVGLAAHAGQLDVLGLDPRKQRTELLQSLCYIPDVAILPRWARVHELITLMSGMHPKFSADRSRELLRRTSVGLNDKVKQLSRGMVVQLHLALIAAVDARIMILDEPTLGLDVLSRKAFYELLINEWCDGERTVLISTHQVEEVEALLSDVMMLNDGKLVLNISLDQLDQRYSALSHAPAAASAVAAAHPLLRYGAPNGPSTAIFDGAMPSEVEALGQRVRPSLVDLFLALTRAPELNPRAGR
ncbi:MAG TPA: ABC transporter ATP-binding protein [Ideonella sp.]|uniref:ABC transporter ATP-binding protein n=1 Tax=Ideonella sp. TaxID=1929293 RepID=UPI002C71181C|nr:ABC transporter ATP-binding protein [Ideonella sp.]HSI49271.1 ABC transporter ATP-binding protein [Ideonella sp.]